MLRHVVSTWSERHASAAAMFGRKESIRNLEKTSAPASQEIAARRITTFPPPNDVLQMEVEAWDRTTFGVELSAK